MVNQHCVNSFGMNITHVNFDVKGPTGASLNPLSLITAVEA